MIEWRESYNCHSAAIAGGAITLSVAWNSTAPRGSPAGYVVTVNNRKLKMLAPSAEDGKKGAIKLARRIIAEASADLEGEPQ